MISSTTFRSRFLGATLAGLFAMVGILCGCSGGSGDTATPPTTAPAASTPPPAAAAPGGTASADGATLFASNCSGCHGDKGAGGKRAPTLAGKHTPEDEVSKAVTNGKGKMPSFKGRLKDDEIKSIAKYVASL